MLLFTRCCRPQGITMKQNQVWCPASQRLHAQTSWGTPQRTRHWHSSHQGVRQRERGRAVVVSPPQLDRPRVVAPPPPLAGARGGLLPPPPVGAPVAPALAGEDEGIGLGLSPPPPPPPLAGVIGGLLPPHPLFDDPPPPPPRVPPVSPVRRLAASGPSAGEGRVPRTLGGAVHRRVAGGPEPGRAWEAGRARPSQEDSAAAPARRASGTST